VFEKFRGEYVRLFCEKIWTVWGRYFREFLYCLTFPKRVFELKEPVLFNQFFISFRIALPKSLQIKGGLFEGGVWAVKAKKCLKGWTLNFEKLWVTCVKSAVFFLMEHLHGCWLDETQLLSVCLGSLGKSFYEQAVENYKKIGHISTTMTLLFHRFHHARWQSNEMSYLLIRPIQ